VPPLPVVPPAPALPVEPPVPLAPPLPPDPRPPDPVVPAAPLDPVVVVLEPPAPPFPAEPVVALVVLVLVELVVAGPVVVLLVVEVGVPLVLLVVEPAAPPIPAPPVVLVVPAVTCVLPPNDAASSGSPSAHERARADAKNHVVRVSQRAGVRWRNIRFQFLPLVNARRRAQPSAKSEDFSNDEFF
jgi:hypothetical protein